MERIASLIMMLCVFCISNAANYLTFTAEEDSSTFGIAYNYLTPDVQYSLDGGETWTELAVGDTVQFRNIGSYSNVFKPPFILPNCAMIEMDGNGKTEIIKQAESIDDIFHTYVF